MVLRSDALSEVEVNGDTYYVFLRKEELLIAEKKVIKVPPGPEPSSVLEFWGIWFKIITSLLSQIGLLFEFGIGLDVSRCGCREVTAKHVPHKKISYKIITDYTD